MFITNKRQVKGFFESFRQKVEIPILWYPGIELSEDSTAVEIGALSGNISLYAWKTYGVTNVYAVEALLNNYKVLVENTQGSPIKTVNVAIGEHDGEVSFFEYGLRSSSSLFKIDSNVKHRRDLDLKEETRVRSVTLDTFMHEQHITTIDCFLMNCEGAETFIFSEILHNQDILAAKGLLGAMKQSVSLEESGKISGEERRRNSQSLLVAAQKAE